MQRGPALSHDLRLRPNPARYTDTALEHTVVELLTSTLSRSLHPHPASPTPPSHSRQRDSRPGPAAPPDRSMAKSLAHPGAMRAAGLLLILAVSLLAIGEWVCVQRLGASHSSCRNCMARGAQAAGGGRVSECVSHRESLSFSVCQCCQRTGPASETFSMHQSHHQAQEQQCASPHLQTQAVAVAALPVDNAARTPPCTAASDGCTDA